MFTKCKECEGRVVIECDIIHVSVDTNDSGLLDMTRAICLGCGLSTEWVEYEPPEPQMGSITSQKKAISKL